MSRCVEMTLTDGMAEQAIGEKVNAENLFEHVRGKKVDVKDRVEHTTIEGIAEDRGYQKARDEVSDGRRGDVLDCSGLKISATIIGHRRR